MDVKKGTFGTVSKAARSLSVTNFLTHAEVPLRNTPLSVSLPIHPQVTSPFRWQSSLASLLQCIAP